MGHVSELLRNNTLNMQSIAAGALALGLAGCVAGPARTTEAAPAVPATTPPPAEAPPAAAAPVAPAPPVAPPTPDYIIIGLGSDVRGAEVVEVQELLNAVDCEVGPADGIPGRLFFAGLKDFQSRQGLEPDGSIRNVGGATRPVLDAAAAAGEKVCPDPAPVQLPVSRIPAGCGPVLGPPIPGTDCSIIDDRRSSRRP